MAFGPTGKFPEGMIGPKDEGELQMGIAHDSSGLVHINFGIPIASFSLPQEQAIAFAKLILHHAGVKKIEVEI